MVLNIADDVFIGDAQVSEVYAGDEEIWCAGTSFELDVTRFERTESLVYALLSKSQKGGVQYGAGYIGRPNGGAAADVIDIVFSVPANLPEVDSYSYITPVDPSEIYASRDPVGWTFQKSTDGGVTWTVLDTRSNVPNPGRGNETERFYIM